MPTGAPGRKRAPRGSGAGRKVVLLRVPVEIAAAVDQHAERLGVSANEAWTRAGAEWALRQTHRERSK